MSMTVKVMKTSDFVKKIMFRLLRNSNFVSSGFITYPSRLVAVTDFDEEECRKLCASMVINVDNVIAYLKRKYIPTYTKNGAIFKDQKCIQRVVIKEDKSLLVLIDNSEPHKVVTDTIHVMNLLRDHGFEFSNRVKYVINQSKFLFQDIPLYVLISEELGFKTPSVAKHLARDVLRKYSKLENVAKIKKRSIKRKFLRYYVKLGMIDWKQLRKIMTITDFKPAAIKKFCDEIREESRSKGYNITI